MHVCNGLSLVSPMRKMMSQNSEIHAKLPIGLHPFHSIDGSTLHRLVLMSCCQTITSVCSTPTKLCRTHAICMAMKRDHVWYFFLRKLSIVFTSSFYIFARFLSAIPTAAVKSVPMWSVSEFMQHRLDLCSTPCRTNLNTVRSRSDIGYIDQMAICQDLRL